MTYFNHEPTQISNKLSQFKLIRFWLLNLESWWV